MKKVKTFCFYCGHEMSTAIEDLKKTNTVIYYAEYTCPSCKEYGQILIPIGTFKRLYRGN